MFFKVLTNLDSKIYNYIYYEIIKGLFMQNKLKELRKKNHVTQEQMATFLGVSYVQYYKYEKGQTDLSTETLIRLANFFHCTTDEILGLPVKKESPIVNVFPLEKPIMLPVYGEIAAGTPINTEQSPTGEYIYEDQVYGDGNHIVLRVIGDSMYPDIVNGSYAIIRCQNYAQPNQIVAVCLEDNSATLKKYVPQPNGIVIFQPINPSYQPIVVTKKQMENGEAIIIGVLREVKRKF